MNASKRKGTAAETAVVDYARDRGIIHAERRALSGNKDRGDIAGLPAVVLEVKSCREIDLAGWTREAETERINDGADLGIVIAKKRGTTNVGDWYAILPASQLFDLLAAAGYAPQQVAAEAS